MSSLRCKRCGLPVSDAYSKESYCASCGKKKSNLEHVDIFFRAFSIFSIIPILVALILALVHINSNLTYFYFIAYQAFLTILSMIGFFINGYYLQHFDKSK